VPDSRRSSHFSAACRQDRAIRPHVIYLAPGFAHVTRSRETANQLCALGWDVTVLAVGPQAWEGHAPDGGLPPAVDPTVDVVEADLARADLATDIRGFSEKRARDPHRWMRKHRRISEDEFPEPVFGRWRRELEDALVAVHRRRPADLLLTAATPRVALAATWRLWREAGVPYALDMGHGWSVDLFSGREAFARNSAAGEWERRVLAESLSVWCVNEPVAHFYRTRYPQLAARVQVVRDGYDAGRVPRRIRRPAPRGGLTFGYVGSLTIPVHTVESVLAGWRAARTVDPLIARSRLEIHGDAGTAPGNPYARMLTAAAADGVGCGPPAPAGGEERACEPRSPGQTSPAGGEERACEPRSPGQTGPDEGGTAYERFDALVLMLAGGSLTTPGNAYEFMATGLPVLAAYEKNRDVSSIMAGHPMWIGPVGLDPARLARSFRDAAGLAIEARDSDRAAARAHARGYSRTEQLGPALRRLADLVRQPHAPGRPVRRDGEPSVTPVT
jgi:hypothetical protein